MVNVRTVLVLLLVMVARVAGQSGQTTTKIYESENFGCEELKVLVQNLYLQIMAMNGASGYIIIYEGRYKPSRNSDQYQLPHIGEGNARIIAIRKHMRFLRISDARIKIIFGGFRKHLSAEYFVVPTGGLTPKPSLTLKRMRHRKGPVKFYINPAEC